MKNEIVTKLESIRFRQCQDEQFISYIFRDKVVLHSSIGSSHSFKTTNRLEILLIDGAIVLKTMSLQGSWKEILQKLEGFTL